MKPVFLAIGAALALSACADYGGGAPNGYYDASGYNAYYDDAYGPFYDGFWNNDVFFFSRGRGQRFERDDARHFQRSAANGFHGVHGNFHSPASMRGMTGMGATEGTRSGRTPGG